MLKFIPILVLGLAPVLGSCNADSASTARAEGPCSADAAQSLVGKPKPTDGEAIRITNSKTVRQIEPNQAVTHDFREDRVTIETDPATGRVVGARCG
jgi:hypothetical protein